MDIKDVITILLMGISLSVGAILGAIRSKIFATKEKNNFHYFFYAFSGLILMYAIYCSIFLNSDFNPNTHTFKFIVLILAFLSSMGLSIITYVYLSKKYIYNVSELDPIINTFTSDADKDEIKLFGGDLNFFGNAPTDMDANSQYNHLKSLNFNKVLILCEEPNDKIKQIRY